MCNPSQYINEICHNCNPQSYDKTLAKFTGQEKLIEVVGSPDDSYMDYLYECCKCGEQFWVDEKWVRDNAVNIKSIKRRSHYIYQKMMQLDSITDAHRYTRRLALIMTYHKLLSEIEAAEINKLVQTDEHQ